MKGPTKLILKNDKPRYTAFMKTIQTCCMFTFLVEKMTTQYIPFNRTTIIIKQVRMNRAMIGIDLQKVEELL